MSCRETLGTCYGYQFGICATSFQGAIFELRVLLLVHLSLPYPQQEGRISKRRGVSVVQTRLY
jgi:hypothetical protein